MRKVLVGAAVAAAMAFGGTAATASGSHGCNGIGNPHCHGGVPPGHNRNNNNNSQQQQQQQTQSQRQCILVLGILNSQPVTC